MMEKITDRDKKIIEVLKKTKKFYRNVIEMHWEDKERYVVEYFKSASKISDELKPLYLACEEILNKYPKGSFPHDSTLIDEVNAILKYPFKSAIPISEVKQDLIVYKHADILIQELFDEIKDFPMERFEQLTIERLRKTVHCTLVDNPNIKGDNPYYHRHPSDYTHAKKLWLEILDEEYDSWIEYFMEPA